MQEKNVARTFSVKAESGLEKLEKRYRTFPQNEVVPYASGTSYAELASVVFPCERTLNGEWQHPVLVNVSYHWTTIGIDHLCRTAYDYLQSVQAKTKLDILSVSGGLVEDNLELVLVYRPYGDISSVNDELRTILGENESPVVNESPKLVVPRSALCTYAPGDLDIIRQRVAYQDMILAEENPEIPLLNRVRYVRRPFDKTEIEIDPASGTATLAYDQRGQNTQDFYLDPSIELVYDLQSDEQRLRTKMDYETFMRAFRQIVSYLTNAEKTSYEEVLRGRMSEEEFMQIADGYIRREYVQAGRLAVEDLATMEEKVHCALFEMYVLQALIDDENITDIKITSPFSIRVRVKGKAYASNVNFIDYSDYARFINALTIKNNILLNDPVRVFTDQRDPNYIMRFSFVSPYISNSGIPVMHIRKIPRKKPMADDLIKAGMFDESIRDYILDQCREGKGGIVIAGPPGCGKTTFLNWMFDDLDGYSNSSELLIMQESGELFNTYRTGVIIENVCENPQRGQRAASLEDLAKNGLVAGSNVFIIGEVKGGEICDALNIANVGCPFAFTAHSESAEETPKRLAYLATLGRARNEEQAMRMLAAVKTVIYLKDFKVQEITEIVRFDEAEKRLIFKPIYKRSLGAPGSRRAGTTTMVHV